MKGDHSAQKHLLSDDPMQMTHRKYSLENTNRSSSYYREATLQKFEDEQDPFHDEYSCYKDKSYVPTQRPLSKYLRLLLQIDGKYQVLHPQSKILLGWNLFMTVAIIFNFFEIPMALFLTAQVYESETNTSLGLFLNVVFLLGFYFDMILRFNVGYYSKGKLIKSRRQIIKRYLKFGFWVDLVSTLVLQIYIVAANPSLVFFKFIFYLKFYSLFQLDRSIFHYLELHRVSFAIYKLIRIVIIIWFITTWTGCIFFAIDYYFYNQKGLYYQQGQLWLINSPAADNIDLITNFSWEVWYEYALYWALQTSSTIGYGTLTAMNPPEVLYCCFVMLFTTVIFAFFINIVWEVISELQYSSVQYSDNWHNLKILLGNSQIPNEVRVKVSNYLYEIWQDNDNEEMEAIINKKLSKQLREQFYFETRFNFFSSLKVFLAFTTLREQNNRVLGELAHLIQEVKIGQQDSIYEEGEQSDSIYYVKKGKVSLTVEGSSFSQELRQDQSFGTVEFFQKTKKFQSAKAIIFCKLWVVSYHEMVQCLKGYPLVYEKFCEISDKIIVERDVSVLEIECWNCQSRMHSFIECPMASNWRNISQQQQEASQIIMTRKKYQRKMRISKKINDDKSKANEFLETLQVDAIVHTTHYHPYFNLK